MGIGEGICGGSCGGTKRLRRPEYDGDRRGNGSSSSRGKSQNIVPHAIETLEAAM